MLLVLLHVVLEQNEIVELVHATLVVILAFAASTEVRHLVHLELDDIAKRVLVSPMLLQVVRYALEVGFIVTSGVPNRSFPK